MRKQQAVADLQLQVERSRIAIAVERFVSIHDYFKWYCIIYFYIDCRERQLTIALNELRRQSARSRQDGEVLVSEMRASLRNSVQTERDVRALTDDIYNQLIHASLNNNGQSK